MSKRRYSSKSSRGNPYQDQQKSKSTQQANYQDSLTAGCLIRTFMEKGNMEDPILKTLFIGGSKQKEGESEKELLFRRMKNCWMEKGKNYGMKEFLSTKMKEYQLVVEVDSKWAKFSLMGAPLIIVPKIWINRQGEERRFLKDFQLDFFGMISIYQKPQSEFKSMAIQKQYRRWDQFSDKNPVVYRTKDAKRTLHMIVDDLELLHHVNQYRSQIETLEQFYESKKKDQIQLVNRTGQAIFVQPEQDNNNSDQRKKERQLCRELTDKTNILNIEIRQGEKDEFNLGDNRREDVGPRLLNKQGIGVEEQR